MDTLLDSGAKGTIELATSTLTIVEVAFAKAEKDHKALDPATEVQIDKLWYPHSAVRLIEFNPVIARRARELMRLSVQRGQKTLGVADAIHLASAESVGATHLYTYNLGDFKPYANDVKLVVSNPPGGQTALLPGGQAHAGTQAPNP